MLKWNNNKLSGTIILITVVTGMFCVPSMMVSTEYISSPIHKICVSFSFYRQSSRRLNRFASGYPHSSAGKDSACNAGDPGSIPGSGKIPWRRKWQPTPVFLPGKSHGQRSLAGYIVHMFTRVRHDSATKPPHHV